MTARFSFVTDACQGLEAVYWRHFVQDFLAWRGVESLQSITHPRDWCFLCTVACIRWPRVVAQAITHLDGAEPREMTVSEWHAYLLRLLDFADGHEWHDMWNKIAPRPSVAWTGLCSWAKRLKLVEKLQQGHPPADEKRRVFRLGRGGISYQLLPEAQSQAAVERVLVAVSPPPWPSPEQVVSRGTESLLRFAQAAGQLATAFMGGGGASGRQYLERRLLSLVEHHYGSEVWDPLSMDQLSEWAPDANGHCTALKGWACERARLEFGMSPLEISSAAFCWGTVEREAGSLLLAAKPSAIMSSIRQLHQSESAPTHDGNPVQLPWWPSLRELTRAMQADVEQAEA